VTTDRTPKNNGLPAVAPLWAEGLSDTHAPTTAQQFFGEANSIGASAVVLTDAPAGVPSDPMVGSDRLRRLGPLIVDDYDLAPDLIRMYTALRHP
jgi:hypothetical protein